MKRIFLAGALACGCAWGAVSDAWDCATLATNASKVADWMLAHPPRGNHKDWTYGAFYAGVTALGLSDPSARYLDVVREEGRRYGWKLEGRPYHADSHCIGQTWLELARADRNLAYATPTARAFDFVLDYRSRTPVAINTPKGLRMNFDRWCWCDALFMAPPVWAKLAAATGDERYRDFMISEYRATHARLYDKEEHLFYRDSRYIGKTTKNGKKVFWSRGCGWVFGGLPLVIRELPEGLRTRPFFESLFKEMAAALKACQREDGAWSPSLLDSADPDMQEMSGTSFFCYGMMWGINNGFLPAEEYLPCAKRAWAAMCRNVSEEGKFGWVQQIGDRPVQDFGPDSTEVYAVGAYLLAATEIRKYAVAQAHPEARTVEVAAVARPRADTVEVPWKDCSLAEKDLVVFDLRDAAVLPHQLVDSDGDGAPDKLIFPATFVAGVPRAFAVFNDSALARHDLAPSAPAQAARFALWQNGRAIAPDGPATQRNLCAGPVRSAVETTYAPLNCGDGLTVRVRCVSTRDRGQCFTKHVATFEFLDATDVTGGPVMETVRAKRRADGLMARPDLGWIADFASAEKGPELAAAFTLGPSAIQTTDTGRLLLARAIRSGEPMTWYVADGGAVDGGVATPEEWREVVSRAHAAAQQPLAVNVR